MATPTRTFTIARFFKKAIKNFIKNKIIYPISYYYGYYSSGGIGTQNLLKRYSTYIPNDWTAGGDYYYIRTVNNNLSVPPFGYDWTASSYTLWFNTNNGSGFVPIQIPFSMIEYGGTFPSPIQFNRYTNWQTIDVTTQKHELMRNSYLRVKLSDLNLLSSNNGYSAPYLNSSEVWGTGVFPTGVTYNESSNTVTDGAWLVQAIPNNPVVNNVTTNNDGTVNVNLTVDTGGLTVNSLFIRVYDPTGTSQLAGTAVNFNMYGQNANGTFVLPYLTIGQSYTIRVIAINAKGQSSPSNLSSVFTA